MPATFKAGPGWQGTPGPYIERNVLAEDCYPHSLQGPAGKDALANGLHPILAIGNDAVAEGRSHDQLVGVMVTYNLALTRAVMNIGKGFVCKDYSVANVLTYAAPNPATFETSFQIGMKVYIDDSLPLAAGVTLSLSPLNVDGLVNPHAGWLWPDQTEDPSFYIGGANVDVWPKAAANSLAYVVANILLK